MDVLTFAPKTGLFRIVEDGVEITWYYRYVTKDWTTNPNDASKLPKNIAEAIIRRYPTQNLRLEFVPND